MRYLGWMREKLHDEDWLWKVYCGWRIHTVSYLLNDLQNVIDDTSYAAVT